MIGMLILGDIFAELTLQPSLIDLGAGYFELGNDFKAEGYLGGSHFEDFLVKVDDDEALLYFVAPLKLFGEDALEEGRFDLGHEFLLAALIDFVVHLAIEEVIDLFLIQQIDILILKEVPQGVLLFQFGKII